MVEHVVLIATGGDRTGVVEQVSGVIVEHGGNVVASRVARLGGEFAMLMLIAVPAERSDALSEAVGRLDYTVHLRRAQMRKITPETRSTAYGITVTGADRAGIIHQIARALSLRGVNIETMSTDVVAAPITGEPTLAMSAVVAAPAGLSAEDLQRELASLGQELGVGASVLPHR